MLRRMAVRGRRSSPWALLRGRADIVVRIGALAPGVNGWCEPMPDGRWMILLGRHLSQSERSSVLRHELEHVRRGGGADAPGMPASWAAVVARDELAVDRAVADELVPPAVLDCWLVRFDEPVSALEVAEEFECSVRHAELALAAAARRMHSRLVPLDELAAWLAARGDEPTTARDVALEWDVTDACAARALGMLSARAA